ncbi:MAG: hypothetical protein WHS46_02685 [Desulfosoma sp.]
MKKPRLGIFKLTSCDGCQLTVLNLEDDLVRLVDLFEMAYFPEAMDKPLRGTLDLALVEGSVSVPRQRNTIVEIRERSRHLIAMGSCATSGGLQALRNWANLASYKASTYPSPQAVQALSTSTPISEHVHVDYELYGCPITTQALSETLVAFLLGRRPMLRGYSVCMECKRHGIPCLLVSQGQPCLGPVTRAGCEALCPSLERPCYGCFGPKEDANVDGLLAWFEKMGLNARECQALLDKMNTYTFRKARLESRS